MGNCQAIDAATLVIQHPSGKIDNFYWPMVASDVMKMNPGHYVALLISTTVYNNNNNNTTTTVAAVYGESKPNTVRVTKIKLLRPTDTLVLGQVYRLITYQEMMRVKAKKNPKISKIQLEKDNNINTNNNQVIKHESHRQKTNTSATNSAPPKSRTWRPSLNSITEAAS
ncbi:hypothetical protein ACFE04_027136 [Oxalis oulophora]